MWCKGIEHSVAVVGSRAGKGRQEGKIAKTQNLQEMAPELKCEAAEGNPLISWELENEAPGYQSSSEESLSVHQG